MRKLFGKRNSEAGAVTIEATIALTSFLFMFIMVYSLVTICRAQAQIQVAINATAKEISQYSYIYGLTGLDQSLGNFQKSTSDTEDKVNSTVGNVATVFESIQSMGDTGASLSLDPESIVSSWDSISADLETASEGANAVKQSIEEIAENPQALLLGMAKLVGSKALDEAKSRLIAEPVSRALVQKHLKRSDSDTAEAFCASVGIVPGTYFGAKSYFNGIDFSHSTLFPNGTAEITIVAAYKIKLVQLLPIETEFSITQSAVTHGWLHGDADPSNSTAGEKMTQMASKGQSIWNDATVSERTKLIRSMGVDALKEEGYYGVSGETYIQAYDPVTNTFVFIASTNPLYETTSIDEIDREEVKEHLQQLAAQMNSATDNKQTIKIKKTDANGNLITSEVNCAGASTKKIIVVIPEDEGLKEYYESLAAELDGSVEFEFQQGYGKVYEEPAAGNTSETTAAAEGEEN